MTQRSWIMLIAGLFVFVLTVGYLTSPAQPQRGTSAARTQAQAETSTQTRIQTKDRFVVVEPMSAAAEPTDTAAFTALFAKNRRPPSADVLLPALTARLVSEYGVRSTRTGRIVPTGIVSAASSWLSEPRTKPYAFSMVFHDSKQNPLLEGGQWYDGVYHRRPFDSQRLFEHLFTAVPCEPNPSDPALPSRDFVVQIGSHLGIFPMMGVAHGCSGVAVDTFAWTVLLMRMSAAFNGWLDRFWAINAAGGSGTEGPFVTFDPMDTSIHMGANAVTVATTTVAPPPRTRPTRQVPVITLDALSGYVALRGGKIKTAIVDVEGFENAVLLGARSLIASKAVALWVVEVWFRRDGVDRWDDASNFAGLQLLWDAGYVMLGLYGSETYPGYRVEHTLASLEHLLETARVSSACDNSSGRLHCYAEILAVRNDIVPALRGRDLTNLPDKTVY